MLTIARYGCALRQGREALAFARHKQSSGLLMSGLSLDRTPFERAARSRPKNSQALSLQLEADMGVALDGSGSITA